MLAIYFDNGDLLTGDFQVIDTDDRQYSINNEYYLLIHKHKLKLIRLGKDGWWYPNDRIVKFKDLTDEEVKQLQRDGKLNEVLQ